MDRKTAAPKPFRLHRAASETETNTSGSDASPRAGMEVCQRNR